MATSKFMASSTSATTSSRNSDLRRNSLSKPDSNNLRNHHHQISQNASAAAALPSQAQTTARENTLLNAEIMLLDAAGAIAPITDVAAPVRKKTVDDVWREIVAGKKTAAIEPPRRVEPKEEAMDEMMTLEDFLVKAGAVEESAVAAATAVEGEVKVEPTAAVSGTSGGMFAFESPYMARQGSVESGGVLRYGSEGGLEAMGSGVVGDGLRRKRTASNLLEPMDKAAQQRQRRMIKNRESAARSRERKQAYQVELEAMAVRLEEENEQLLKEKAERTKERCKLLMEKVIPVVDKRRPTRTLRRVRSMAW